MDDLLTLTVADGLIQVPLASSVGAGRQVGVLPDGSFLAWEHNTLTAVQASAELMQAQHLLAAVLAGVRPGARIGVAHPDPNTEAVSATWVFYGLPGIPAGVVMWSEIAVATERVLALDLPELADLITNELAAADADFIAELQEIFTDGWAAYQAHHDDAPLPVSPEPSAGVQPTVELGG